MISPYISRPEVGLASGLVDSTVNVIVKPGVCPLSPGVGFGFIRGDWSHSFQESQLDPITPRQRQRHYFMTPSGELWNILRSLSCLGGEHWIIIHSWQVTGKGRGQLGHLVLKISFPEAHSYLGVVDTQKTLGSCYRGQKRKHADR